MSNDVAQRHLIDAESATGIARRCLVDADGAVDGADVTRAALEQRLKGGVPIAVQSGGDVHYLTPLDAGGQWEVRNLLIRKQRPGNYVEPPAGRQ